MIGFICSVGEIRLGEGYCGLVNAGGRSALDALLKTCM